MNVQVDTKVTANLVLKTWANSKTIQTIGIQEASNHYHHHLQATKFTATYLANFTEKLYFEIFCYSGNKW